MLIFQENVPLSYRAPFLAKVQEISRKLEINPNWLMAVMNWESARTFSPSVKNPYSSATGLIQFMRATAIDLGTTVEKLAQMSAVEQLDWVYKYYARYKSKLNSYTDLYLTTFYPVAVGKSSNYILGGTPEVRAQIARVNPAFDINKDQMITKGEIEQVMLQKLPSNWIAEFKKKMDSSTHC